MLLLIYFNSGSLKSNIGHLEGASGGAGIMKAILTIEKGVISPNALFEKMNPAIDADLYKVQVCQTPNVPMCPFTNI